MSQILQLTLYKGIEWQHTTRLKAVYIGSNSVININFESP